MENEIWKDVKGYEGYYQVSNMGRVKSMRVLKTPKNGVKCRKNTFLSTKTSHDKQYILVALCRDGEKKQTPAHRLVAEAFIPNPNNLPFVNHKDENPSNNNANNLEWCDRTYNNNYGGHNARSAISRSKAVMQYTLDGKFVKEWLSGTDASRQLSIPQAAINACCLHKPKYNQAGGFLWKYKDDSTPITFKHGKRVAKCGTDGTLIEEYRNITEASKKNHLLPSSISNCLIGRSKFAGGYKWKLIK